MASINNYYHESWWNLILVRIGGLCTNLDNADSNLPRRKWDVRNLEADT